MLSYSIVVEEPLQRNFIFIHSKDLISYLAKAQACFQFRKEKEGNAEPYVQVF